MEQVYSCNPGARTGQKPGEVVDKDMANLHFKPSDAMDGYDQTELEW